MRKFLLLALIPTTLFFTLLPSRSSGQSYWFNFTSIPYVEIGGNFLALNEAFDDTLYSDIPIGFQFRFAGRVYTKLHISSNGEIYFGDDATHLDTLKAVIPFGADLYGDYINHTPAISYESGGCAGAVVMKIQFKECSLKGGGPDDYINFQVWLYESSGTIEYHFGMGQSPSTPACFGGHSGPMCGIRFSVPEASEVLYSLLLTSFAFAPDTSMSKSLVYLEGMPEEGMVYIFEPSLTTYLPEPFQLTFKPSLYLDEASNIAIVKFSSKQPGVTRAAVYDISGQKVLQLDKENQQEFTFSTSNFQPGIWLLTISNSSGNHCIKFLLQD
jgi:hypothetical protein